MGDETRNASEASTGSPDVGGTTDDELPEITCTLTDEAGERRKEWVAENLLSHLSAVEERDDGYTFVFERSPDAYAAVAEVAWKESQCCAWATFEVELPPGDAPIRWHERSDRPEGGELFGDAVADLADEFDAVATAVERSGPGRSEP